MECEVAVRAGAFRGDFRASLRPEEFAAFRGDLERLHRDLRGLGRFDSMERQVAIQIRGDGRGHFAGSCRLLDRAGDGNCSNANLSSTRQTFLQRFNNLRTSERHSLLAGFAG